MPNWQPNWNDVVWDYGAANEAIAALHKAAGQLESSVQERKVMAAAAQTEWRGRYRQEFDNDLARMIQQALRIADEYRAVANRIRAASAAAQDEQSHRVHERERWWREKRDEERRAQEERERRERERQNRR
jgi:uncharacterized protein YukE